MRCHFIIFFFSLLTNLVIADSNSKVMGGNASVISDSTYFWESKVAGSPTNDSIKIHYYSKLIEFYLNRDPGKAINYMHDAYCSVSSLLYPDINEQFTYLTLKCHSTYSDLEESSLKQRILNFSETGNLRNLGVCYYLLSFNSTWKGLQETAIKYGLKADKIFRQINDSEGSVLTALILVPHLLKQEEFEKCRTEIEKVTKEKFGKCPQAYKWVKNYLWMLYFESLPQYDSLLHYSFIAFQEAPTKYHKAFCNAKIGFAYLRLKEYDKAIDWLGEAKERNRVLGNKLEANRYMTFIAEALIAQKKYKKSIDTLMLVLKDEITAVDAETYVAALRCISDAYSKSGEFEKAYEYRLKMEAVNDSLFGIEVKRTVADVQGKYESDKKDAEIAIQKSQLFHQRVVNYGAIGIALILIFFLLIGWRNYRQKKRVNSELQAAKERAERSERYKQQFLANVSHEIRTPMNTIVGMTNLLIDKDPREDQIKYLSVVADSSQTLMHVISDILDSAKIDAGKIEIEHINFSIRELLEKVKDALSYNADEKKLSLNLVIHPNIPDVLIGDPNRLNQVLLNLGSNAIKFTEKGSVKIEVIPDDSGYKFSVIDTGIGIPKEKLDKVFDSFTQAHTSDSRRFGGTGLGLTISRQLVEMMGGILTVKSAVGIGSEFSFTLEFPVGSESRIEGKNSSLVIDGHSLDGLSILLADDNSDNRMLVVDALNSKANLQITEVVNGQQVLELLLKKEFDVILMDVQMPVMDGIETTVRIRGSGNPIPIIALTASLVSNDIQRCKNVGMNDFIPKPFTFSKLVEVITKNVGRELLFSEKVLKKASIEKVSQGLNLAYLEEFCEGDQERLKKYLDIFKKSASTFVSVLNTNRDGLTFVEISKLIHEFKTKLIMMGMEKSRYIVDNLEQELGKSDPDKRIVNTKLDELTSEISSAINQLKN